MCGGLVYEKLRMFFYTVHSLSGSFPPFLSLSLSLSLSFLSFSPSLSLEQFKNKKFHSWKGPAL